MKGRVLAAVNSCWLGALFLKKPRYDPSTLTKKNEIEFGSYVRMLVLETIIYLKKTV